MTLFVLAAVAFAFALAPAVLYFRNVKVYRSPPTPLGIPPGVSVLIPARNEEFNIGPAVRAALASADPRPGPFLHEIAFVEVIVLDDHSEDRTAAIVREMAWDYPEVVRLASAPPLPAGWCGKQHACHVLSSLAGPDFDMLLFIDADVRLTPNAVARAAQFLRGGNRALVSGIPRQETGTVLEQLLIPLFHFLLLGFLPFGRMRNSTLPAYGAGCGQFFLTWRGYYEAAGGHAAIRASLHDGLTLPRAFRRAGLMTDLFDATSIASCRMYHSASDVWFGLAKNAREGLASTKLIVPATVTLLAGQVLPFVLLCWWDADEWLRDGLTVAAIIGALAPRIDAAFRFRQPLWAVMFHPLGITLVVAIQWFALLRDVFGFRPTWKGRRAVSPSPSGPAGDSPSP